MGKRLRTIAYLLPVIIWMAVIWWFSAQTANQSGAMSTGIVGNILGLLGISAPFDIVRFLEYILRKMAHATEYALLAVLTYLAASTLLHKQRQRIATTIAWCSVYAAIDEWHQFFVPGRSCMWQDWLIDTIGASVGCFVIAIVYVNTKRRAKHP